MEKPNITRLYAGLLSFGAGVLLFRTFRMLFFEQALNTLEFWVFLLLLIEFSVDLLCLLFSLAWLVRATPRSASLALKLGATATIMHFVRVAIFVLGRTRFLDNFDIQANQRRTYQVDSFWVGFAGVLALLGMLGLLVIWRLIRHHQGKYPDNSRHTIASRTGNSNGRD